MVGLFKIYPIEYIICKNIINFCEYRGMKLDREHILKKNGDVIVPEMPIVFYADKDEKKYQIIYIPNSASYYKKAEFVKIAKSEYEIIVIKDAARKIKYEEKPILELSTDAFMINHGKAWAEKGQVCTILSQAEVDNYCQIHKFLPEGLPMLSPESVESIWYGLTENQVVEITSTSVSSAGLSCQTRRVGRTKAIDIEELLEEDEDKS